MPERVNVAKQQRGNHKWGFPSFIKKKERYLQMNPAKRRTVIAGNWKMNFTPDEATAFINEIKPMVAGKDACDIIFCAPYAM